MADQGFNPGFIVIPGVVFGVFFTGFFAFVFYRIHRRRKMVGHGIFLYDNANLEKLDREAKLELELEIEKRKREEVETGHGSQVWFSRYVNNGRLRHWVMIINGIKYELRRDHDTDEFTHNVAVVEDWDAQREKREAALAEVSKPEVDGFYVCLIGWTTMPDEQLRAICAEVMAGFGKYRLVWNNCQHFLQQFGDRIISRQALDYPWFREHSKTEYQVKQTQPPPSKVILAAQLQQQQQQQQHHQLHTHHHHQQHHHQHAHADHAQLQNNIMMNNLMLQNMLAQSNMAPMQTMQAQQNMNMNMNMGMPPGAMGGAGMSC